MVRFGNLTSGYGHGKWKVRPFKCVRKHVAAKLQGSGCSPSGKSFTKTLLDRSTEFLLSIPALTHATSMCNLLLV